MDRTTGGFTIHELIVTLALGTVILSIAVQHTAGARQAYSVNAAQTMFRALGARARAHAIERGSNVLLHVDASADSAWVTLDGAILETIRFGTALQVDVQTMSSPLYVCFTPRGYADPDCNSFTGSASVRFVAGSKERSAVIRPLGQVTTP